MTSRTCLATFICTTCGTQFAETDQPPAECKICIDERQFVGWDGQQWTTLEAVQREHTADVDEVGRDLYGITITPGVGIGHRPLLVRTPAGNLLWDAPGYIDDQLIETVKEYIDKLETDTTSEQERVAAEYDARISTLRKTRHVGAPERAAPWP